MIEYTIWAAKEGIKKFLILLLFTATVLGLLGMGLSHYESHHPPSCKVCHCGKTSCHRECGEENMCNLKCEGLCHSVK